MRRLSLSEIEQATAAYTRIDLRKGAHPRRKSAVAARRLAFAAMRYSGFSTTEIGAHFGLDHSTIVWAGKKAVADEDLWAVLQRARSYAAQEEMTR